MGFVGSWGTPFLAIASSGGQVGGVGRWAESSLARRAAFSSLTGREGAVSGCCPLHSTLILRGLIDHTTPYLVCSQGHAA